MKPGPADIDLLDQRIARAARAASASARSRGFLPASLASTIAALVRQCRRGPASRGGSTTMRDRFSLRPAKPRAHGSAFAAITRREHLGEQIVVLSFGLL